MSENNNDFPLGLLTLSNYIRVNLKIAKKVGITPAFVLAILFERYSSAAHEKDLFKFKSNEHFFKVPIASLMEETNLGYKALNGALDKLKEGGFIYSKLSGLPASTYFAINPTQIIKNS